jgi:hypothetical protein
MSNSLCEMDSAKAGYQESYHTDYVIQCTNQARFVIHHDHVIFFCSTRQVDCSNQVCDVDHRPNLSGFLEHVVHANMNHPGSADICFILS